MGWRSDDDKAALRDFAMSVVPRGAVVSPASLAQVHQCKEIGASATFWYEWTQAAATDEGDSKR